MTTTEILSAIVTVILFLIFFTKFRDSAKKMDFTQFPPAKPEDVEIVREHVREVSEAQINAIAHSIRKGNLIVAIKLVREAKNMGLKESKDLVESIKKQFI